MRKGTPVLLVVLVLLVFVGSSFAQVDEGEKGEEEAEQALQDFKEVMEDKETKSYEETAKKYEEGAKARNRLLGLGKLATPVLVRAIRTKKFSEQFRGTCIDILYKIGDENAIEPLIEVYRDETEISGIRKEAIYAVGKIGGPEVLPVLLEALENRESRIRKGAISGIWGLVGRGVVEFPVDAIVGIAKNDTSVSIRAYATASLRLGGEQAVLSLLELINDENERVRLQACQSLGLIGDNRAVGPLLAKLNAKLNDKEYYEKHTAIIALGKIGDKRAVEPLIKILNERGPYGEPTTSASYAAKALAEIGDERAIEPLKRTIEDDIKWKQEIGISPTPDKWFTNAYKKLTGKEYK
jgi:HEAT repeat protein